MPATFCPFAIPDPAARRVGNLAAKFNLMDRAHAGPVSKDKVRPGLLPLDPGRSVIPGPVSTPHILLMAQLGLGQVWLTSMSQLLTLWLYSGSLGFALAKGLIRGLDRYPNPPLILVHYPN